MKSEANKKTFRYAQMTEKQEMATCAQVGELLHTAYPGHIWRVEVRQGLVTVHNLMLSGRWGFVLKVTSLDSNGKAVIMAGGELLERYNLSRAKRKAGVKNEIVAINRTFTGEAEQHAG